MTERGIDILRNHAAHEQVSEMKNESGLEGIYLFCLSVKEYGGKVTKTSSL